MSRKIALSIAMLLFSINLVFSQKVKYKDLILLLDQKQYETAEPHLKRYLKENRDDPNANLFMGIILQEKSITKDVLLQTELVSSLCDSANQFFDVAYATITEKELKRNDEYYQMYSRRDMRTGEFAIKLSDVRLDLETRIKNTKSRKEKVRELKRFFDKTTKHYSKCQIDFKVIQSKYPSEGAFYFQSDTTLVNSLTRISQTYDSVLSSFLTYKSILKQITKTSYNQQLRTHEIVHFNKDGSSTADFTIDDVKIWDYKKWANASIEIIAKEINPLRDRLVGYDISLNKIHDKLKKDSVSVIAQLAQVEDKVLYSQIKKYDSDPLPLGVFEMKKAEMQYQSKLIVHKQTKDSISIVQKLSDLAEELKSIHDLDSIAIATSKKMLEEDAEMYHHFVTKAYGTKAVLTSLINTTIDYANREKLKKEMEWETTMQATKWAIVGADSIPLYIEQSRELKFKPLLIVEDKYTVGLHYKDSLASGYFYTITPTRIPDVKALFAVDESNFTKRNLPVIKSLSISDALSQVFLVVIYSESKIEDKFPVTIAKIYRSDGLAWSTNFKLDYLPTELSYNSDNGELSIKISSTNESKIVVIDKSGKQLQ